MNRLAQLVVSPCTNIRCSIGWKNNTLAEGTEVFLGFFLGEIRGRIFYLYYFTYEGVDYYIGSIKSDTTPVPGYSKTTFVDSHAYFSNTAALPYWDVLAWAGYLTGTVRVLRFDTRIIGLNCADVEAYLRMYHYIMGEDLLEVITALEVMGFSLVTG